jgi:hypothetical protein
VVEVVLVHQAQTLLPTKLAVMVAQVLLQALLGLASHMLAVVVAVVLPTEQAVLVVAVMVEAIATVLLELLT